MTTLVRLVAGGLLVAHGLVHLLYLAEDVPEFTLTRSWVVPSSLERPVGLTLVGATVVGFALVGLAVWGVPGLVAVWPALTIAASAVSLALLASYWDAHLAFGVAIGVALVAIALMRPEWTSTLS